MDPKQSREAGALAIRNAGIVEQAYHLLEGNINSELFCNAETAIHGYLPVEWEKELPSYKAGEYSDSESWFAPTAWKVDSEWKAWFEIWEQSPTDSDSLWLALLCGLGETQVGFRWHGAHRVIRPDGGNLTKWKTFAAEQNSKHPKLAELGFRYEDGTWFMPIFVDVNALADGYANEDMMSVLEPAIEACIKRIIASAPEFDSIMAAR